MPVADDAIDSFDQRVEFLFGDLLNFSELLHAHTPLLDSLFVALLLTDSFFLKADQPRCHRVLEFTDFFNFSIVLDSLGIQSGGKMRLLFGKMRLMLGHEI